MPLSYLSKSPGIGGKIKSCPEDFLVEEIGNDGTVFEIDKAISHPDEKTVSGSGGARERGFVHFILQKKDWSTQSAISEIAKRLHTTHKAFNAAGNKDKTAITTQRVSASGIKKEELLSLDIKDIKINGAWHASERVHMGSLLGNRFTIRVREPIADEGGISIDNKIEKISIGLGNKFPNYFGEQRFGSSRKNTYPIGLKLIKGEVEEAVRSFLLDTEGETHTEARLARVELASSGNYNAALNSFPRHLRLERSILAHLAKRPDDYAGALRQLPRSTLLMFIHAVQSYLFNRSLSDRLEEGALELEVGEYFCGEKDGFPDIDKAEAEGWIAGKLIGYQTPLNDREKKLMEGLGIRKEDFRVSAIPEINSKGSYRTLLAPMKDFNLSFDTSPVFRFSLQSGSYATVAMREFMKNEDGSC